MLVEHDSLPGVEERQRLLRERRVIDAVVVILDHASAVVTTQMSLDDETRQEALNTCALALKLFHLVRRALVCACWCW